MLQSHEQTIHILPALPPEWAKGKVTGLKARGNITVDIEWDEMQVEVKLYSDIDRKINLKIMDMETQKVELKAEIDYLFATKN